MRFNSIDRSAPLNTSTIVIITIFLLLLQACQSSHETKEREPHQWQVRHTLILNTHYAKRAHQPLDSLLQQLSIESSINVTTQLQEKGYTLTFSSASPIDSSLTTQLSASIENYNKAAHSHLTRSINALSDTLRCEAQRLLQLEQERHNFNMKSGFNIEPIPLDYTIANTQEKMTERKQSLLSLQKIQNTTTPLLHLKK